MFKSLMKTASVHLHVGAICLFFAVAFTFGQSKRFDREPACRSLMPASTGGAMPQSSSVMVLRYLGTSNYEIAYRGKVILLDAFYDGRRGPGAALIGFRADDVKRADAVLIGHPHLDHFADAPSLAKRVGVPVFVAPAGRPILEREQVPTKLIRYVVGNETIRMSGFTVRTALARHSNIDPKVAGKYGEAAAQVEPPTPEMIDYLQKVVVPFNPPSTDPEMDIPTRGTIAFVLVFDDGFKVAFRDSPGAVTDGERDLIKSLGGGVNIAIIAHQGFGTRAVNEITLALARLYNPKIFLPAHQDRLFGGITDFATAPLFTEFRRELPETVGIDPLYRSPICVNTKTGEFSYGQLVR